MMKQNKKIAGVILITFLLPMLACAVPRTLAMQISGGSDEEQIIKDRFDAIVVSDDEYDSTGQADPQFGKAEYSCTINTGSFYDVYLEHRQSPYATTEKSEIEFKLVNTYPNLTFDFSFHAIGTLKNVHPDGTFLGDIKYVHLESGEGTAIWEDDYFYGSISYNVTEISTYQEETSENKTSGEFTGIGALSPNREEIHVCLEGLDIDQFDMVKALPFDQLRLACISNHYFICTPE